MRMKISCDVYGKLLFLPSNLISLLCFNKKSFSKKLRCDFYLGWTQRRKETPRETSWILKHICSGKICENSHKFLALNASSIFFTFSFKINSKADLM